MLSCCKRGQRSDEKKEESLWADRSEWMGTLPKNSCSVPLNHLILPGSHNSCTYSLSTNMDVANDQPSWLQNIGRIPFVKKVVYNWSVTQSLGITDQLKAGARYIDMRVSCPDDRPGTFRVVHGLYGSDVTEILQEIDTFLDSHPKEVLLLDFNHFYNVSAESHRKLMALIEEVFQEKLCPPLDPGDVTLGKLWKRKQQVLVFYHAGSAVELRAGFWNSSAIESPWPATNNVETLKRFLLSGPKWRERGRFFVSQGLLTPAMSDVLKRPFGSLECRMGAPTTRTLVQLLQEHSTALRPALNIVICDCINFHNFCDAVIQLNYS